MTEAHRTSYDEVPYLSHPFVETHPDRLFTVAWMHGMSPAPVERCRVLEIACARGDNLIPMATELPESEFTGIDLSQSQVDEASNRAERAGLGNLRFEAIDVAQLPHDFGEFDYIIAHGIYSWISDEVRRSILEKTSRHLAPQGVAFVSYNVFPGWRIRAISRDIMLFHTRGIEDPKERIEQSKAVLDFIVKGIPASLDAYRGILDSELQLLKRVGNDSYLFHEFLEEHNQPVLFCEFAESASRAGLQYLAEADLKDGTWHGLPPIVAETLAGIGEDVVRQQQYRDFVTNNPFRETLLCKGDVSPDRTHDLDRLGSLYFASQAKCSKTDPNLLSDEPLEFKGSASESVATRHPLTKAALTVLSEAWPASVGHEELQASARARLVPKAVVVQTPEAYEDDRKVLDANLWAMHLQDLVEIHATRSHFTTRVSGQPSVSPWARCQVAQGPVVTNMRHESIALEDFERRLVSILDGTRNHDQLAEALAAEADRDHLVVQEAGRPLTEPQSVSRALARGLGGHLGSLARKALLIS